MEPDDLLAHQVQICGPIFSIQAVVVGIEAQLGNVVGQGVQPNVYHVLFVKGDGNAPLEAGAGYAKILQAGKQEVLQHLVGAAHRLDEFRMGLDVLNEPVRILGKPEEIAFLLNLFHRPAAIRAAAVHQLALQPEAFAGGAIQALIAGFINIPLVVELLEDLLHRLNMVIVGGAHEAVVGDVHQLPQGLEGGHDIIHILLGGHALFLGLALDLLAMLVRAGEEIHVIPGHALIPGDGVRGHGAVGMADVQLIAGVVDGRGNIVGFLLSHGYRFLFHLFFSNHSPGPGPAAVRLPCGQGLVFPGKQPEKPIPVYQTRIGFSTVL